MIIHTSGSRGHVHHGWLESRHTFSFADYHDPDRMGFGKLRVINDDSVAPGMGFGTHPHRDMEIISIPLIGSLEHKDSEGNHHIIKKGEVQIMSAGTGIAHSEYNASSTETVRFLQIWVLPKNRSIKPSYGQKFYPSLDRKNKLQLIISPDGREGSLTINQDAFFSLADLDANEELSYRPLGLGSGLYLFVLSGEVDLNDQALGPRDGAGLALMSPVTVKSLKTAEVLLIEVPL